MNTIPLTPETKALARRLIWFEEPEDALSDTSRFAACAFARATHADMKILRAHLSDDDLREALDGAPPGIIDARSWAYWNSKLGRYPPRPCRPADSGEGADGLHGPIGPRRPAPSAALAARQRSASASMSISSNGATRSNTTAFTPFSR